MELEQQNTAGGTHVEREKYVFYLLRVWIEACAFEVLDGL
jgi:hypothetical protein